MKLVVVTNRHGQVIATQRQVEHHDPHAPRGGRLVAGEGQTVHEVTLPYPLHHTTSAEALHRAVAALLPAAGRPDCDRGE